MLFRIDFGAVPFDSFIDDCLDGRSRRNVSSQIKFRGPLEGRTHLAGITFPDFASAIRQVPFVRADLFEKPFAFFTIPIYKYLVRVSRVPPNRRCLMKSFDFGNRRAHPGSNYCRTPSRSETEEFCSSRQRAYIRHAVWWQIIHQI